MSRLVVLASFFLLSSGAFLTGSCGGGGGGFDGAACQRGTHQVSIRIGPVPPGAGAEARNSSPCNSTITLLEGLPEAQNAAIIVHELWHAVGYTGFHNSEGCYTASVVELRIPDEPCAVELAQMQSVGGTFEITLQTPSLDNAVRMAADFWNQRVGRTMFVYPRP